jgi:hypothetical protein
MFRGRGAPGSRIEELASIFREKGATSPGKAMTAQELGIPPRLEESMKRRPGLTGVFVDVGGKYYLDEARLKELQYRLAAWGTGSPMRRVRELRLLRMAVGLAAIILVLYDLLFVGSSAIRFAIAALLLAWIALTVAQMVHLARVRRRLGARGRPNP